MDWNTQTLFYYRHNCVVRIIDEIGGKISGQEFFWNYSSIFYVAMFARDYVDAKREGQSQIVGNILNKYTFYDCLHTSGFDHSQ